LSGLKIDYAAISDPVREVRVSSGRRLALRVARVGALAAALALLPFVLLIRGGVWAYRVWDLGTWPSLGLASVATALLLGAYAALAARRIGARRSMRTLFVRGAATLGMTYVGYMLLFVASANVKSDDVRREYRSMHPLLRVASSAMILADPESVVTDAGRTPEDYRRMGMAATDASLHFVQPDGYVHALDLRTGGRSELRNRALALAFRALGFHTLRHVGTADHLHVSLRMPL